MLLGLLSFSILLDLKTSELMKLPCCLKIICVPYLLIHLPGFVKHQLCKHPLTLTTLSALIASVMVALVELTCLDS